MLKERSSKPGIRNERERREHRYRYEKDQEDILGSGCQECVANQGELKTEPVRVFQKENANLAGIRAISKAMDVFQGSHYKLP